jgi:hypothetical protein
VFVRAALGLTPAAASGTVEVRPSQAFASWYPLTVDGIQVAGHRLRVTVDESGEASVATLS